jgi:hypothetical protein
MDTNTENERKQIIQSKAPVYIWLNTLLGPKLYSVTTNMSDEGFWLDTFEDKQKAVKFCKRHKLPIVEIIEDERRLI